MNDDSAMLDPELTEILFAVMVEKLGGEVNIQQADIDKVAYRRLMEQGLEDGSLKFWLANKTSQ